MKNVILLSLLILLSIPLSAQQEKVSLVNDRTGSKLLVNGKSFMVNGMNWDYFPVGTNYSYSLWERSFEEIRMGGCGKQNYLKSPFCLGAFSRK